MPLENISEWNPLLCSHFSVNAFPTESLTLFRVKRAHTWPLF